MYRTAFLPALVALCVAAFALADRPTPGRNALPTDVFSAERAFGSGTPEPQSLLGMAAAFPDRTAGSAGDEAARASSSQGVFEAPEERGERAAFTVRRDVVRARDRDLVNVVATRAGLLDAPDRRARAPRRAGRWRTSPAPPCCSSWRAC